MDISRRNKNFELPSSSRVDKFKLTDSTNSKSRDTCRIATSRVEAKRKRRESSIGRFVNRYPSNFNLLYLRIKKVTDTSSEILYLYNFFFKYISKFSYLFLNTRKERIKFSRMNHILGRLFQKFKFLSS